ncbi:hypothetical protein D3C87_234460 [compost metagenome]
MRILYLLLVLVVIGSGCEKYNLKQPAYLSFNWRFHSTTSSQGQVTITKGYFYSNESMVYGVRKKGDPVQIKQSAPTQKVQFSTENKLGITFDIPMGDYTEFGMKAGIDNTHNPCLRLEGFIYKGEEQVPLIIEWKNLDELNFKVQNAFSLEKKKDYKVYIGFDVAKLFSTVSSTLLEHPPISNENGVSTVIIRDPNGNPNAQGAQIFNKITEQMPNALILKIE